MFFIILHASHNYQRLQNFSAPPESLSIFFAFNHQHPPEFRLTSLQKFYLHLEYYTYKGSSTEAGVNVDVEYRLCPMRPGSMHI